MGASYHRIVGTFAGLALAGAPAVTGLAVAGASLALAGAARTGAAQAATLIIDGAGDGHGVGMSQEGALGYAQHGWSYEQILTHYYTGTSLGQAPSKAVVKLLLHGKVKRIPLERYVRGVVGAEVSADWPMAALQAQAVASRTYALTAHAGGSKFDVYSDTRSQMYLGKAVETGRTNAAVHATAGQIVTYGGQPAITYFFASSGGHTENVQNAFPGSPPQPWLVGVEDPYDSGPLHRWTTTLSFHEAGADLKGLVHGRLEGIEVLRRGSSPRIVSAYVLGSKGKTLVSGAQLAQRLKLYDTWAYFSVEDSNGTHPEPDSSGSAQTEAGAVSAGTTAASASAVSTQGGTSGPGSEGTTSSGAGGASASPAQAAATGGTIAP